MIIDQGAGLPMRISRRPLPLRYPPEMLKGADIVVDKANGLRCRILVFRNRRDLRVCMRRLMRHHYTDMRGKFSRCKAVCAYAHTRISTSQDRGKTWRLSHVVADPRFFAVIAFIRKEITHEIIAHEAVHAAFAYYHRTRQEWPGSDTNDQENVCYPAGIITGHLVNAMKSWGYLK